MKTCDCKVTPVNGDLIHEFTCAIFDALPLCAAPDKAAVRILRRAYESTDMEGCDTLFHAIQYLGDRTRYEKLFQKNI